METMQILVLLGVVGVVFGILGCWIASQKHRSEGEGFILGSCLAHWGSLSRPCCRRLRGPRSHRRSRQRSLRRRNSTGFRSSTQTRRARGGERA